MKSGPTTESTEGTEGFPEGNAPARSPDLAFALYEQGSALAKAGRWAEARPLLEESWAAYPHPSTGLWLSRCLVELGEPMRAFEVAGAAHALRPSMSHVAVHFASLLVVAGDIPRAQEILAAVLDRDSNFGPAQRAVDQLRRIP